MLQVAPLVLYGLPQAPAIFQLEFSLLLLLWLSPATHYHAEQHLLWGMWTKWILIQQECVFQHLNPALLCSCSQSCFLTGIKLFFFFFLIQLPMTVCRDWGTLFYNLVFLRAEFVARGKYRSFSRLRLSLPTLFMPVFCLVPDWDRKEIQAKLFSTDKGSLCPVLSTEQTLEGLLEVVS